ncbi:MAG: endolytic transglycosylase MltG, partial [Pyrinomonadaceae bacterium]
MKFVKIALVLFFLAAVCSGGFIYCLYTSLNTPHEHVKSTQYVVIEKGSTPMEIIEKLATEGILNSSFATQLYLRTLGDAGNLQAGEYQFPSPITPLQVLKE